MEAKNRNSISLASLLFDIGTDVFLITAKQVAMRRLKQHSTLSTMRCLHSAHISLIEFHCVARSNISSIFHG